MNWHVNEYDNKNFDSHVFRGKVQGEFVALITAAGGGPGGATVYAGESVSPDNKFRLYFNPKATTIPEWTHFLQATALNRVPSPLKSVRSLPEITRNRSSLWVP